VLLRGKWAPWIFWQQPKTSLFSTAQTQQTPPNKRLGHKFGIIKPRPKSLGRQTIPRNVWDETFVLQFERFKEFVQEELRHHPKPRLNDKLWSKSDPRRKLSNWWFRQRLKYREVVVLGRPLKSWTQNRTEKMESLESLGISLTIIPKTSAWNIRYNELCDFLKRRRCLPTDIPEKELSSNEILLRKWCNLQKLMFRAFVAGKKVVRGNRPVKMTNERAEKLTAIGFVLDPWLLMYDELKDFYKEHGHAHVPANYPCNPKLATWVRNQRINQRGAHRREPGYEPFTRKQLRLLKKLNFEWNTVDAHWLRNYHRLKAYVAVHGIRKKPHDKFLLNWLRNQRADYLQFVRGKEYPLVFNKRRANLLEKLGYVYCNAKVPLKKRRKRRVETSKKGLFGNVQQMKWNDNFNSLLEYYKQTGHFNVPKGKGENGADLERWLTAHKMLYRKLQSGDKVSSNTILRIEKLLSIGYVFPDKIANGTGRKKSPQNEEVGR
jgi:hypothetical protein